MIQTKVVKRLMTCSGTIWTEETLQAIVNNARESMKQEKYFGPALLL
jgi:hypothetical protein